MGYRRPIVDFHIINFEARYDGLCEIPFVIPLLTLSPDERDDAPCKCTFLQRQTPCAHLSGVTREHCPRALAFGALPSSVFRVRT